MKRVLPNWISSYLEYMNDTEYPVPYHLWNAVSCICGALQRRVNMPWGMQKIYPNMYIVLVGRSGLGKGESMKPAIDMFMETGLPVAAEAITIEELMCYMEDQQNSFMNHEGKQEVHSSVSVFAKELAVLLGQRDIKKISHLTDWYDSANIWKNETKNKGSNEILGVCLNLLGAAAPDWFGSMLPIESMGGGFTSRIIFVVEQKKAKIIARPIYTDKHRKLRDDLITDLSSISTFYRGEYKFSTEAEAFYETYYIAQETDIEAGVFPVPDPTFEGYANRRALHLRKLAMVFATARGEQDGIIQVGDFKQGIQLLSNAEKKMPRLFGGVGKAQLADVVNKIMEYIIKFKKVTRSQVLRAFYKDVDSVTIKIVEDTLSKMKFMTVKPLLSQQDAEYLYNEDWTN